MNRYRIAFMLTCRLANTVGGFAPLVKYSSVLHRTMAGCEYNGRQINKPRPQESGSLCFAGIWRLHGIRFHNGDY